MEPRRAAVWISVFAALGVAGGGVGSCGERADRAAREARPGERGAGDRRPGAHLAGRVVRVVDGDTVLVRVSGRRERVRYIGVDTPESRRPGMPAECYARAASAFNARLVAGRVVDLRVGAEPRDRHGRLLAYVHRRPDGLFVNAELVRRGYASTLAIAPNLARARELARLQRAARGARRGLWSRC